MLSRASKNNEKLQKSKDFNKNVRKHTGKQRKCCPELQKSMKSYGNQRILAKMYENMQENKGNTVPGFKNQ